MKADDKVKYEGFEEEKFTHFDELKMRVELLQELLDEHAEILRQNKLVLRKKIEAPYFDEDEVYKRLGEEVKEEGEEWNS